MHAEPIREIRLLGHFALREIDALRNGLRFFGFPKCIQPCLRYGNIERPQRGNHDPHIMPQQAADEASGFVGIELLVTSGPLRRSRLT